MKPLYRSDGDRGERYQGINLMAISWSNGELISSVQLRYRRRWTMCVRACVTINRLSRGKPDRTAIYTLSNSLNNIHDRAEKRNRRAAACYYGSHMLRNVKRWHV